MSSQITRDKLPFYTHTHIYIHRTKALKYIGAL